ncbi:MAG: hypothetical protein AAGA34_15495 [Pseudomonadota bacterium]
MALFGCADQPTDRGDLTVPPALKSLDEQVFRCWIDTDDVPLEHSENCVLVGETLLAAGRDDCELGQSDECDEHIQAANNVHFQYQHAIIKSAINFQVSEEIVAASKDRIAHTVYFDGELLRGLFEDCLRMEQEALAKKGLQRISSVMIYPLAEDQMCIREGNGGFETAPL